MEEERNEEVLDGTNEIAIENNPVEEVPSEIIIEEPTPVEEVPVEPVVETPTVETPVELEVPSEISQNEEIVIEEPTPIVETPVVEAQLNQFQNLYKKSKHQQLNLHQKHLHQ